MVFSLLLFALVGIIGFFLYTQGFFSATISAICAVIAAVVAMGWYETAAPLLFNAKIYDSAASIALCVIFAATFIIPRLIIDSLVPGNVRVPFIVEKIGAGVMGLIAGLVSTGIVAVAADALPFGPTVGMYARFATTDQQDPQYQGMNGQMQDTKNYDVFTGNALDPDDPTLSKVWLHQDDLVTGLAEKVSAEDGSLSYDHPMAPEHPDLLDELYGQRLGIQPGAKHTAVNTDKEQVVTAKGVYTPSRPIPQVDGEPDSMRIRGSTPVPTAIAADGDHIVIILRLNFSGKDMADDADNLLRYSASAIRLVTGQPDSGVPFKDYYPIATLDDRGTAVACRPDDFLFSDMGAARTVDFVFMVDRDHVIGENAKAPPFPLPQGTFVEFKRYAVVDLSGQNVIFGPPPNKDKTPVMRKPSVQAILTKTDGIWTGAAPVAENTPANPPPANSANANSQAPTADSTAAQEQQAEGARPLGDSGLGYISITASSKLAVPINCGTGNDAGTVQLPNGVGGELDHRQWTHLSVPADATVSQLSQPQSDDVADLFVEPNMTMVQVQCSAPVSGSVSQMWAWGQRVSDFALADATGHTYPCIGVWATAQRGVDHLFVANYNNLDDKNHLQSITAKKGRPVNVWLAFQVPSGTPIAEIRFSANPVVDNLNFKAP